jgi:hypothetical protein
VICLVSGAQPILRRYAHTGSYGQLIVPRSGDQPTLGLPWACDNGGYHGFEAEPYLRMLGRAQEFEGCLWVTAPDVYANPLATLDWFDEWERALHEAGFPVALVAQDGLLEEEVPWDRLECLFMGGTLEWKLGPQALALIRAAKARGKLVHAGRAGTIRRIRYFGSVGVDTCDSAIFSRHAGPAFETFTPLLTDLQLGMEVE